MIQKNEFLECVRDGVIMVELAWFGYYSQNGNCNNCSVNTYIGLVGVNNVCELDKTATDAFQASIDSIVVMLYVLPMINLCIKHLLELKLSRSNQFYMAAPSIKLSRKVVFQMFQLCKLIWSQTRSVQCFDAIQAKNLIITF